MEARPSARVLRRSSAPSENARTCVRGRRKWKRLGVSAATRQERHWRGSGNAGRWGYTGYRQ